MATPKHRGKPILNSPRLLEFKKKKQKESKRKLLFFVVFSLVIFFGLVLVTRWERVNIAQVEIIGNKVVDTEDLKNRINEDLAGHYLWTIPKTNFLFYPKNKILVDLKQNFERLESLSLEIKDNTLLVQVVERKALYTWCGQEKIDVERESEGCYFLDDSGYLFDKAPYFSGAVYFRFYGDIEGDANNPLGSHYNKEIFNKLTAMIKNLEDMDLSPVGVSIDPLGEIKMHLPLGGGALGYPEILFRTSSDFVKISENLDTALSTDPLKKNLQRNMILWSTLI